MGKIKSTSAILIIGVLVIEDLAAIVIISVLHSGIISGSFDFMQILMIICEIGLFIGGTTAAGTQVMPRIFTISKVVVVVVSARRALLR
jgi:CPA2 family monovalent cation:H+ antiporter-2